MDFEVSANRIYGGCQVNSDAHNYHFNTEDRGE